MEKVDNPTCSLSVSLSTSDEALDNNGTESVAELETKDRRQELKDRVSDWNSYEEEEIQEIKEANSHLSHVSPGTPLLSESQSLITNPHSTYPLSGCDDDIAPEAAVDTLSTFSPPVDSVSTIPDVLDLGEVTTGLRRETFGETFESRSVESRSGFDLSAQRSTERSRRSPKVERSTSVDVDLTAPVVELDLSKVDVDLTAPVVELDLGLFGAGLVAPVREELQEARRDFSSTSPAAPALPQKWKIVISITKSALRIALSLDNCPAHYEKGNLDEESRAKNGDYTPD